MLQEADGEHFVFIFCKPMFYLAIFICAGTFCKLFQGFYVLIRNIMLCINVKAQKEGKEMPFDSVHREELIMSIWLHDVGKLVIL